MNSLLIYLVQTLKERYPLNSFSFKELRFHITHTFRIIDREAREIVKELIKIGMIKENKEVDKQSWYNIDLDIHAQRIFKFNERRLKDFKKSLGLKDE
jgi:hypothetical protein